MNIQGRPNALTRLNDRHDAAAILLAFIIALPADVLHSLKMLGAQGVRRSRGPREARPHALREAVMTELLHDCPPAHLPARTRAGTALQLFASALIHLTALAVTAAVIALNPVPRPGSVPPPPAIVAPVEPLHVTLPRIVFEMPSGPGGGGGGGGNRDRGPIRRATAPGRDRATLRTRQHPLTERPAAPETVDPTPAVLLDARSLASGESVQAGLPVGGVSLGMSQGPGSGGGVGTGSGTGIGPGRGPGIGPGSGGGTGGGVYRIGNGVSAPRLLAQTLPRYTTEALERRIQGTVSLDVVVARDGTPMNIRVARSLDAGLDQEAIVALRQWRFSPGTLGGRPVDVEVVVAMDFWIR
jgi:TonB family protein